MTERPYARVLLKLSGEVLMGRESFGIDIDVATRLANEIAAVHAEGIELGVVIGGGNIFRGLAGAARGMDRAAADELGMLATVFNALALKSVLLEEGTPSHVLSALPISTICENYSRDRARALLIGGSVVIFAGGTGNPFFTTDSAAALRAAETGCDVIIKGTKVDGVYSDDPVANPKAQRFERLSHDQALQQDLRVMDATAIALARDNSIPIIVFSILEAGALVDVVRGRGRYTLVSDDRAD